MKLYLSPNKLGRAVEHWLNAIVLRAPVRVVSVTWNGRRKVFEVEAHPHRPSPVTPVAVTPNAEHPVDIDRLRSVINRTNDKTRTRP